MTPSSEEWQRIGRQSQAMGEAFEGQIEASVACCISADLGVWLTHTYTKVKRFSASSTKTVGKARPDYIGACRGIPVMFDAKSTGNINGRFSLPTKRRHQFDDLKDAARAGFVAGIFVQWEISEYAEWFNVFPEDSWPFCVRMGTGVVRQNMVNYPSTWIFGLLEGAINSR